jgi:hypothetical protein
MRREERATNVRTRLSRGTLVLVGALATQCNCHEETIAQPYGAPPHFEPDAGTSGDDAGTNAGDAGLPPLPKQ